MVGFFYCLKIQSQSDLLDKDSSDQNITLIFLYTVLKMIHFLNVDFISEGFN